MDVKYNKKQLIAVDYPGTVLNVENMEKTLGGKKEMVSVFKSPPKRLDLKFRPNDPYCKSAHGDLFNTTNILMKVVKRTRKKPKNGISNPDVQFNIEFLGVASSTYQFKSLADFQVLPVTFDKNKQAFKSLIPDIVPTELHPASWLEQEVDFFIPPLLYSRFDFPQNGYIDIQAKTPRHPETKVELPPNIIGRSRKRRAGYAVFTTFESADPCDEPQPEALEQLQIYPLELEVQKRLQVLFNNERPIWTRNALLSLLKCDRGRLKHALPCTAYYFTNGPWRALWVKFGYNPRKDPASKIYQIMDLRISPNVPIDDSKSKRKPAYYALPNKSNQNQQRVATINTNYLMPASKDDEMMDDNKSKSYTYEYFPGKLPTLRQCFFQLCDIHLESVQKLVHQNDGREETCHEKDGWCELGVLEKCRELIIADIQKTAKNLKETG
ncbi:General transcription factor 3C polypeptide 5, partial [Stegodyphus mimosarum]